MCKEVAKFHDGIELYQWHSVSSVKSVLFAKVVYYYLQIGEIFRNVFFVENE
ncbi:hypothetical protein [Pelagicoccus sp. SDUM812002]|uniref:hypothetical protein n=1 Tax=Pelagicoccus sp. SDUM812002 TaxID=3041266 RepID=UPI002810FCD6|nr:hypothetical protein [Pelagicoccus sp. SDUM812002]